MRVDSVRKMNELLGKEFETNNFGKTELIIKYIKLYLIGRSI